MDNMKMIRRKILLKRQLLEITRAEITDLEHRLNLVSLKDDLEKQIGYRHDSLLRQKIDCINFLVES